MKKFISFVMAAAMVASLVPATAFAKGDVTATGKIVDSINSTKGDMDAGWITEDSHWVEKVPELQLTITNTDYRDTEPGGDPTVDVTLSLDNATFAAKNNIAGNPTEIKNVAAANDRIAEFLKLVSIRYDNDRGGLQDRTFTQANNVTTTGLNGEGEAAVYERKTGKAVMLSGSGAITAAADNEAFLQWLFDVAALDAEYDFGTVANAWKDDDDDVSTAVAARTKVIENGAFVTGYTIDDFITDVINGHKFATTAAGTTDPEIALTNFKITVGNKDYVANTWSTPALTNLQDKANAYIAVGYEQGYLKNETIGAASSTIGIDVIDYSEDQVTYRFTGKFAKDDMIIFDLCSLMDRTGEGRKATVSVSSKMFSGDDLVYAGVSKRGISASTKKVGNIAEEEIIGVESDIKVSSTVGDFVDNQWFELRLSNGFEFSKLNGTNSTGVTFYPGHIDGKVAYIQFDKASAIDQDTFTIAKEDFDIESTSAKSGSTCTLTVKALDDQNVAADGTKTGKLANAFNATTTVEVMKVVDYKVELTVDADEDVPVIYSGVNVENYGITDDSDHWSLEVTAKETFPGAWSMRKGFNFELPEHVYVADLDGVDVTNTDNFYWNKADTTNGTTVDTNDVEAAFWNAYQNGSHVNFEFDKRVFDDVDSNLRDRECAEMTFKLKLVADPGFEGDVVLKLTGDLVDEQEVTIAKFVKPYEVKAEQNDLKIDYRYTDIPTAITITEAEKGLWAKNTAEFFFGIETGAIRFEDDPTFEIDSNSGLEIKDNKADGGQIKFTVKAESDEPATVTIKDMQLFMNRSIPAGPYDLLIASSLEKEYLDQVLFAPDNMSKAKIDNTHPGLNSVTGTVPPALNDPNTHGDECDHKDVKSDSYVGCVADYSDVVKEAFVNVITAGREVDDASFTTKVVVPVGENYIVAGEKQIELDTPAYINAAGYTMLPIRAVATALGINNNNVLWDQPTKTVTILYGQRIITMTQGQKVVYVNGSAIPASAAVENTNSRTFLPMRDLATALGVTDITWDQATRTATLNGNQNATAAK